MEIVLNGKAFAEKSVIALGMFDGVHIGHKVLLERARVLANREKCPLIVCTFQQHPMELLCPEKAPKLLTTPEERQQALEAMGADMFFALPFDRETAEMPPECYVGELVRRFHPAYVVCGYNHHFGKDGSGSPALLEVLGGALGFQTSIVPQITLDGRAVSASDIRLRLEQGDAGAAARLLGRPYARRGTLTAQGRLLLADLKQPVQDGKYRCRLTVGERKLPVTVCQKGEVCFFSESLPVPSVGEAVLEYLCPQK